MENQSEDISKYNKNMKFEKNLQNFIKQIS